MLNKIHQYNVLQTPWPLADNSVDCIVTSPPYYGLRDYGVQDQVGLEETLDEYIEKMTAIFNEGKRVLKDTGTLWLNLGDTYAAYWGQNYGQGQSLSGNRENNGSAPPKKEVTGILQKQTKC